MANSFNLSFEHFGDHNTIVSNRIHKLINHPVHIIDEYGIVSPSALIPFCVFGRNMSIMGIRTENFSVPVCNSFNAKILNDQLCYEVDLNRFSNKNNIGRELKLGFHFVMDYNEDRQITTDKNFKAEQDQSLAVRVVESDENSHAFIYLNTVGKYKASKVVKNCLLLEEVKLIGEGEYNLNALKEVQATESFLGLDQEVTGCQNEESLHNCSTRKHINTLVEQCGCLPFNIRLSDEVYINYIFLLNKFLFFN